MNSLIGQTIAHYHIVEQLGEGGMAIVYKAFDTHLERDVAVKVIRTDQFAPAILEKILKRFEREAKLLAKLSHPNIVGVIDYGEYENIPYLVMEYLPGGTLKERLGKPIPADEAARLLLPIARALDSAHRQGMIHRDVKPSNILITNDGEPMLTDFGIAKLLDAEEGQTLTGTGVGIGTPEYMAPEQWLGQATAKSDQYSLGVIFYEMVTGHKPYTADTPAAILLKQTNDPLPSPKTFVTEISKEAENVIYKAMARNSDDRFPDMSAFSKALLSLTSQEKSELSLPVKKSTSIIDDNATIIEDVEGNSRNQLRSDEKALTKSHQKIKPREKKPLFLGVLSIAVLGLLYICLTMGIQGNGPLAFIATDTIIPTATTSFSPTKTRAIYLILSYTKTPTINPSATFTMTPTVLAPATMSLKIYNRDCHEQKIYVDGNLVIILLPGEWGNITITYGTHYFHSCTQDGKCTNDYRQNLTYDTYWYYTVDPRPGCYR